MGHQHLQVLRCFAKVWLFLLPECWVVKLDGGYMLCLSPPVDTKIKSTCTSFGLKKFELDEGWSKRCIFWELNDDDDQNWMCARKLSRWFDLPNGDGCKSDSSVSTCGPGRDRQGWQGWQGRGVSWWSPPPASWEQLSGNDENIYVFVFVTWRHLEQLVWLPPPRAILAPLSSCLMASSLAAPLVPLLVPESWQRRFASPWTASCHRGRHMRWSASFGWSWLFYILILSVTGLVLMLVMMMTLAPEDKGGSSVH